MPSIINVEPDSFDLDNFLSKYSNRFGSVTHDNNVRTLKVLPINFIPTTCDSENGFHFFTKPTEPIITTCLCKKYHTYFASQHITIPLPSQPILENTSDTSNSMEIDFDIKLFKSLKSLLRSKFQPKHEITHPFPIFCSDIRKTSTEPILFKPFSHHAHTCIVCKTKNIPCIILKDNKHSLDPLALTFTTNEGSFPAHTHCIHSLNLNTLFLPNL